MPSRSSSALRRRTRSKMVRSLGLPKVLRIISVCINTTYPKRRAKLSQFNEENRRPEVDLRGGAGEGGEVGGGEDGAGVAGVVAAEVLGVGFEDTLAEAFHVAA